MKLLVHVKRVEVVNQWGRNQLEVSCTSLWGSGPVTFRCDDNETSRRTYHIGRVVDIDITPRRS